MLHSVLIEQRFFFSFVHDNFTLLSTQFLLLFRFKYVSPVRLNVNLFVEAFFVALSFDDGDGYGSCEKLDDDGSVMIFYKREKKMQQVNNCTCSALVTAIEKHSFRFAYGDREIEWQKKATQPNLCVVSPAHTFTFSLTKHTTDTKQHTSRIKKDWKEKGKKAEKNIWRRTRGTKRSEHVCYNFHFQFHFTM